ncbi:hypothetical protein ABZ348_05565 [Streptomyces sp. NPDC005963]|uniref:hypothetical protein n=1 Tax=Streptomyces sp. NPDC005963 TaxID=3156721 RepID=UPI0033EC9679
MGKPLPSRRPPTIRRQRIPHHLPTPKRTRGSTDADAAATNSHKGSLGWGQGEGMATGAVALPIPGQG